MAKFIYKNSGGELEDNREATKISFDVSDDMTINEFKIMCKRMASAMGYRESTIEKAFYDGEE